MESFWEQVEITLPSKKRGCHYITNYINNIKQLKQFHIGTCHLFLKHTSASICVCESWDEDVKTDMEYLFNKLVPENDPNYIHTLEGPDDMPGHGKNVLVGCDLTLPIRDGRLNMGQWQGVWLCEHRNRASGRRLVVTMNGAVQRKRKKKQDSCEEEEI